MAVVKITNRKPNLPDVVKITASTGDTKIIKVKK
jgi:hypothetical protein